MKLTQVLDGNLSHSDLPVLNSHCRLTQFWLVKLGEDGGRSISCLEGVIDVEEGKLEEELVDKPGTTIGTKFSVLHCIRIPFLRKCGF